MRLPERLSWLARSAAGREWLGRLPSLLAACVARWSLQVGAPYEDSNVSLVLPATWGDGTPAVLKIQFPHRECEYETEALRRLDGRGAVRLLDSDPEPHALLIERCEPGRHLSTASGEDALAVVIALLPRLWVEAGEPFTRLADEAAEWAAELPDFWERAHRPFKRQLLDAALEAIESLSPTQGPQVLIHQDLHGDNILEAEREPWLAIDPKPLVGEREFSLAPIIRSYEFGHSREQVVGRLDRLSEALRLDRERARLWAFAQTLAWSYEGDRVLPMHLETARWLREA